MKVVDINIVRGNEGFSLQVGDNEGFGTRVFGPKAWGNPYNQPTCTFKITEEQVEELYKELKKYLYEKEQPKVGGSNE